MLRIFALALCIVAATPVLAAPLSLDRLSAYLNGISTAEARFTQYNSDGTTSDGMVYISRPGKMRFEYDPPSDALVLANGGQVAIFDPGSNEGPQTFPLGSTPLGLILKRKVDLGQARLVQRYYEAKDGQTVVVARDPDHESAGQIELYFSASPVALTQWIITDEAGFTTAVRLQPLATGKSYDNNFFSIGREARKREK